VTTNPGLTTGVKASELARLVVMEIRTCSPWALRLEGAHLVGQRVQHVPAEAARRPGMSWRFTCGGCVDNHGVLSRIDHEQQCRVRNGRPDQPGAGFVDSEAQALRRRNRGSSNVARRRSTKVRSTAGSQLGSDAEFDPNGPGYLALSVFATSGHVTPGNILAGLPQVRPS